MRPRALILHAQGSNRDWDVNQALELAGACPEIVPLTVLRSGERRWTDYQMLVLPGGFSYADALGAGKLLALDLITFFFEESLTFIQSGKPVIGICNGFQALIKAGLLLAQDGKPSATLSNNSSGHFECRWVTMVPKSNLCVWTRNLEQIIYMPVAHGEGKFVPAESASLLRMQSQDQITFQYSLPDGTPANGAYPSNPNGSIDDIAGVCNPEGTVLGLMPHPENHILPHQHPRWSRDERGGMGLQIFENGVRYAAQIA